MKILGWLWRERIPNGDRELELAQSKLEDTKARLALLEQRYRAQTMRAGRRRGLR